MSWTAFAPLSALPEFGLLSEPGVDLSPEFAGTARPARDAEAKRTEMADACLREAWQGLQRRLAGLAPDQFQELHRLVREVLPDHGSLRAARYYLAVHDTGKNPRLRRAVGAAPDEDHDTVLAALVGTERYAAARRALLPTFDRLAPRYQRVIREACQWPLGYAKLFQGEVPAGPLAVVEQHLGAAARDLDIVKSIMDVAGARGHLDETVSATLTAGSWLRMSALNRTLREHGTVGAAQRLDGFLDGEAARLSGAEPAFELRDPRERRALARLACHLRITDRQGFARLVEEFRSQPRAVRAILLEELNRDGISSRATLPHYGPALMLRISAATTQRFALTFYAHLLQEAHIADHGARAAGTGGFVVADLEPLARAARPHTGQVRFSESEGVLRPRILTHRTGGDFPAADLGARLRGEVGVVIGIGGGSDCVQAAMLRLLFKRRFGMRDACVVSVRRPEHQLRDPAPRLGTATVEILAGARAAGSWRFLEDVPLEGDDPARMVLLSALDPETVRDDIATIAAMNGATVLIGVDTGGDSLYRESADVHRADASPGQDHRVLAALAALAAGHPELTVLSTVVAPGVDSPPYAEAVLAEAGAACIELDATDTRTVLRQYAVWGMDGSNPDRYGKTPLAWLSALRGKSGLAALRLPDARVLSNDDPWRCFLDVHPGMRRILVMDALRHAVAVGVHERKAAADCSRDAGN
ncbi:DUF6829 domain-containing protein [Streptomyces avermitilis]